MRVGFHALTELDLISEDVGLPFLCCWVREMRMTPPHPAPVIEAVPAIAYQRSPCLRLVFRKEDDMKLLCRCAQSAYTYSYLQAQSSLVFRAYQSVLSVRVGLPSGRMGIRRLVYGPIFLTVLYACVIMQESRPPGVSTADTASRFGCVYLVFSAW